MTTHTDSNVPEKALDLQKPDLSRLAEQVTEIVASELSPQEKINTLLQLTVGLVNGAGALLFIQQDNGLQTAGQLLSHQAAHMSSDILAECSASAHDAINCRKASIIPLAKMPSAFVISCPVSSLPNTSASCLSVVVLLGDSGKEPFLLTIQLMAAVLSRQLQTSANLTRPQDITGKLELLLRLTEMGKDPSLQSMQDLLRQWFGCNVLAVGSGQHGGKIHLKSVSDVVTVDNKTAQARLFTKVMQDCLQHNSSLTWPALHSDIAIEESLLLKELVQASGMRQGLATSLAGTNRKLTIFIFLWSSEQRPEKQIEDFLETAPLLGLISQSLGSTHSTQYRDKTSSSTSLKKKLLAAVLIIILTGAVFYPANFTLHPNCRVAPVQIHYVVARFDGLLQKVFVEPGDRVEHNTQLALLDGRELEMELRSINADSEKALKIRDNHLATGNVAAAQIGLLEYKRLQERAGLLSIRQKQLNLKSPVDGIILSGDIKRAERGPVTTGQVLFEVAPLETILIELALADADISYVKEQASVTVRFDAFPGREWRSTIEQISPKSQLQQGKNVFIASFQIANAANLLQPGMQGQASVECGKRSLLWIYFHKPWYALVRLLHSIF